MRILAVGLLVAAALLLTPSQVQAATPTAATAAFFAITKRAAARHRELALLLLRGLLQHESRFDPGAVSPTGAAGIAQFTSVGMAEVRRLTSVQRYRARYDDAPGVLAALERFNRALAFVPDAAIEAAALFLAHLVRTYGGNVEAALTHYNAGGRAAALVAGRGSHAAALAELRALPGPDRAESVVYAPAVLAAARAEAAA